MIRFKKFRVKLWCALAMLCPLGVAQAQSSLEEIASHARKSTLQISVQFVDPNNPSNLCDNKKGGSGFVITESGYVLSTAHTFQTPPECAEFTKVNAEAKIGFRNTGETYQLQFISPPDYANDVSIWKLGERLEPYEFAQICNDLSIRNGSSLVAFGFPLNSDFSVQHTTFQGTGGPRSRWVVSSDFTYGFSGGPVYNSNGQVVGIIQGGIRGEPAVRFVIPLRHAINRLELSGQGLDRCQGKNGTERLEERLNKLTNTVQDNSKTVTALNNEVAKLNKDLEKLLDKVYAQLPKLDISGAVVAFHWDDLTPEKCPDGWEPFKQVRGRVIVGAGKSEENPPLSEHPFNQIGGTERHKLALEEMPEHTHSVIAKYETRTVKEWGFSVSGGEGSSLRIDADDRAPWEGIKGTLIADTAGKGDSHNNMPPFIALYFCKKKDTAAQ